MITCLALVLSAASFGVETLPPLRTMDGAFIDREGREVVLRGVNLISKDASARYQSWHTEEDIARLRAWGMNCIRLGMLWDGVEPAPGQYDEDYLDYVAMRVEQAARHGLYVFLDMHQDLFSVKYSDGAPAWATLDEGKPHVTGSVWSDAYLLSPAVQTAFDNFWANAPGPDGVGIQERYARMWAHVAARFAGAPNVIGYDLMNEPFPGSAVEALPLAIAMSPFLRLVSERLGEDFDPLELAGQWLEHEGRERLTQLLGDLEIYRAFLDAQAAISQRFEREQLMPMYQRVAEAIREEDPHGILFLETSYFCNAGVPSAIAPLVINGKRDPQQAFAPHGYDIVVDTPGLAQSNAARVALIFERHAAKAKELGMPMIVGEWGAFGNAGEGIRPAVQQVLAQFEKHGCGDTYWDYGKHLPTASYLDLLQRPVPYFAPVAPLAE